MIVNITMGHREISPPTDEHTLLLLHGEEMVDSSVYARGITASNVTCSTTQAKFGTSSLYFGGSTAARITLNDNSFLNFGNGDFTIDWWEYVSESMDAGDVLYFAPQSLGFFCPHYKPTGIQLFYTSEFYETQMCTYDLNVWQHMALVRRNNTIFWFKNGQLTYSGAITNSTPYQAGYTAAIGCRSESSTNGFKGYIDEFRISDIARWTSDFDVPTEAYTA